MCVGDMRQSYVIRSRFDGRGARTNVGREIREGARGVRERPFYRKNVVANLDRRLKLKILHESTW